MDIVHELPSNTPDEMEENIEKIKEWIARFAPQNGGTA